MKPRALGLKRLLLTSFDDIDLPETMRAVDAEFLITHHSNCREMMFRCDVDVEPATERGADWLFDQWDTAKTLYLMAWLEDRIICGACHIVHAMAGQLGPDNKLTVRIIIHGAGVE